MVPARICPPPSPALRHSCEDTWPPPPHGCAARTSPAPLYPQPSPHGIPKNCHGHALATLPPFFIYMFGFSMISTGSADIILGINEACQSHSLRGGKKKLRVHSQKRSS